MNDDIEIIDLRRRAEAPAPRQQPRGELDSLREALQFAWRPAGSSSLGERWLRAGQREEPALRRLSPPRPPAPPSAPPPNLARRRNRK